MRDASATGRDRTGVVAWGGGPVGCLDYQPNHYPLPNRRKSALFGVAVGVEFVLGQIEPPVDVNLAVPGAPPNWAEPVLGDLDFTHSTEAPRLFQGGHDPHDKFVDLAFVIAGHKSATELGSAHRGIMSDAWGTCSYL